MSFLDLSSMTEVDPASRLVVSPNTLLTTTGLSRNDNYTYLKLDKGAGFYNGDFTFKFYFRITADGIQTLQHVISLTNYDGQDVLHCVNAGDKCLSFYLFRESGSNPFLRIIQWTQPGKRLDSYTGLKNTDYWVTMTRVGTTLTAIIYSDEARTTVVDTLTITLDSYTYRYLYVGSGHYGPNYPNGISTIIKDVDLGEGSSGGPPFGSLSLMGVGK